MGGNFIGATGLDENQEQFDTLNDKIDANADYINNLVGIPDPTHTAVFGINILNPGLFGLVERAEVNIAALQTGEEGLTTDLSALTTQVEGIQGEITGIQGEITGIQGEITGIQGEISLIQFTELPAIVSSIAAVGGVAGDALSKANKSLGIWDEDGNNTYNMKSGNVAIGILPKGTLLNNKLEVNGSINIPTGSSFKINNVPFSYSDIAGTPPVSSKWTNATDVATNIYYSTGNVGIGVTSAINNKLEVGGSINIPTGSKYKINNIDLSYNDLTNKLTAGTNISIVSGAINNTYTYTLPTASTTILGGVKVDGSTITINGSGVISGANTYTLPTASTTILGGVKVDGSTITINGSGVISAVSTASGADILLNGGVNNRSYGWTGSTSLLGRVGTAGTYAIGSLVEDVVLRSQGRLLLQSGTNNPALTIETTTNNILVRNSIGIGTTTISSGNLIDVGGFFKVAFNAPVDALTLTSTGVQVNNTLNVSSGFNNGGIIRFGGFSDDSSLDLATIQNRQYATNKSELLLFKGDNIEGLTGVDRIRLRAGAIAFDTFATDATTSASTENIRMFINGSGNVGIGITSPSSLLHLHTTALNTQVRLQLTDGTTASGTTSGLAIYKGTDQHGYFWNYQNNSLIFGTNNLQRMVITADAGNVGIGTTNPTGRLHLHRENATASESVGLHFTDTLTGRNASDGFYISKGSDNDAYIYNNENNAIKFGTGGVEAVRIEADGNLLVKAYGVINSGTKGIYFRDGFVSTNKYNCSILTFDHSGGGANDGISINGFGGVSICTGSNTRQERLRITAGGNVGIGTNPVYKLHIKTTYDNIPTGFHLDADDGDNNPNKYALTLYPYVAGSGAVGWRFRTQSMVGGTNTPLQFDNAGHITTGGALSVANYILSNARVYSRGGGFDTWIYSDSTGMSLNMGLQSTEGAPTYFKMGAYSAQTYIESCNNRNFIFSLWAGVFTGANRMWSFNNNSTSYNPANSSTWNVGSDHRVKENIKKADLKTCYDNIKNINLYRYNFIDAFDNGTFQDKNKLGYIAQEVKKHFPKAIHTQKKRLNDKREIPDFLSIDVEQINLSLYGAVKQLIKVVEKQNKRIKALETLLNIEDNDEVEDDAGQPYERIYDENEIDINTIEPTEPSKEV